MPPTENTFGQSPRPSNQSVFWIVVAVIIIVFVIIVLISYSVLKSPEIQTPSDSRTLTEAERKALIESTTGSKSIVTEDESKKLLDSTSGQGSSGMSPEEREKIIESISL